MDKILYVTLLFDFYGCLLTEKQKKVFVSYHFNDLSLSEIAQQLLISKQAVRDSLIKTENTLEKYEEKLMLIQKFDAQKIAIEEIILDFDNMKKNSKIDLNIKEKLLTYKSNHIY